VDDFRHEYNHDRPHQGPDEALPVTPAQRFAPTGQPERDLLPLWLPPTLTPTPAAAVASEPPTGVRQTEGATADRTGSSTSSSRLAVEFDRAIPPSGTMVLAGRQIWLGPARAGQVVRFWADCDLIHLLIGGAGRFGRGQR
jgi:hypothetical protein